MALNDCDCKFRCVCTVYAIISSIILGLVAAVLSVCRVICFKPVFFWFLLVISIVYLAVLIIAAVLKKDERQCKCKCQILNTLLAGILGTVAISILLLGIGHCIPCGLSAVLIGVLIAFFSLTVTSTACLVKLLTMCEK
ncbi:MAG: hypothetical protein ACI4SB_02895 [Acutalibacteraceae bacterium]